MSEAGTKSGTPWLYRLRLCLAFLLPAAVAGFVGSLILSFTAFSDMISTGKDNEAEVYRITHSGMVFMGTLLGALWGQLATLLVGLPAHVVILGQRTKPAWKYALAGVIAGVLFGAAFCWPMLSGVSGPSLANVAWLAIASASAGAIGGLVFWLIRRPDRDAPASAPPPAAAPAHRTHAQAGDT